MMGKEAVGDYCPQHSGLAVDIKTLKENDKDQWDAINRLRNRPPIWATAIISLLCFLLGCSLTYAGLITRLTGLIK